MAGLFDSLADQKDAAAAAVTERTYDASLEFRLGTEASLGVDHRKRRDNVLANSFRRKEGFSRVETQCCTELH